ncbi:MAG: permease [Candidatus Paceibacteria bacterium]
MTHPYTCHVDEVPESAFRVGKRLKIIGSIFLGVFFVSFLPLPYLPELNESIVSFVKLIWWAVLLGLFIGGLIEYFVPNGFIFKYMGQKKVSSIFYAVIAGFLMSACSHGVLAIAIQLYKKGASIPAVITFLLASPWANLPVTILLFSFFGLKAIIFIAAAMFIALLTGFVYMGLQQLGLVERSQTVSVLEEYEWSNVKNFNLGKSVRNVAAGSLRLANMVLWWLLIGFLIAVFIRAYVPAEILMQYFGPTMSGLFLTLLFATIIEVCSEGSSPIAFEIFAKTGALGNPFVFLMAGVATDYTEIGLIWTNIGKRAAIWLPIITVPQIIAFAILFNAML